MTSCNALTFLTLGVCAATTLWVGCAEPSVSVQRNCRQTCGFRQNEDCCLSLLVEGGTFLRDFDVGTDNKYSNNTHPAVISDFALDKYEVTLGRFRPFLETQHGTQENPFALGEGERPNLPGSGWQSDWDEELPANQPEQLAGLRCDPQVMSWTEQPGVNEDLPIDCVSWYQAMAFCIWDGGYLPTAAEADYAAVGGSEQRVYPWSQPPSSADLSCAEAGYKDDAHQCSAISAVGARPAGDGRWGHSDLTGNLSEWVLDWYTGFISPTYIDPCNDCARLEQAPEWPDRSVRGGGFQTNAVQLRPADWRDLGPPGEGLPDVGFRCARLP